MQTRTQTGPRQRLSALNKRLEELAAVSSGGNAEECLALFQEKRRLEANLCDGDEPRAQVPAKDHSESGRQDSQNVLANVNRELRSLEKRDGELWLIVSATGILAGAGLLALLPAAFLKSGSVGRAFLLATVNLPD